MDRMLDSSSEEYKSVHNLGRRILWNLEEQSRAMHISIRSKQSKVKNEIGTGEYDH